MFGSLAASAGSAASDVDVFVVGNVTLSEVVDALAGTESALGREVNPVVQLAKEFAKRDAAKDHFVARVMQGSKLYLIGDDDVLGRLGAARLACSALDEPSGDRKSAPTHSRRRERHRVKRQNQIRRHPQQAARREPQP